MAHAQESINCVYQLNALTSNLRDLVARFDDLYEGASPIVIAPRNSGRRFLHFIIPEDCYCIGEHNGKSIGVLPTGFNLASWRTRITYLVTKRATTYDFLISDCPTKDNVFVGVNVTFVFRIVEPCDFCFKMGAINFDSHLRSVTEETLRAMIRSINHDRVLEIRLSGTEFFLKSLNLTFEKFGVTFLSVTFKDVSIPQMIWDSMERASRHVVSLNAHKIEHAFALKIVTDQCNIEVNQYKNNEEQKTKELINTKKKRAFVIENNIMNVKMKNERRIIKEQSQLEKEIIAANAKLRDAQIEAQAEAEQLIGQAKVEADRAKKEIDEWKKRKTLKSENDLLCAQKEFERIKKLSASQEHEALKQSRKHEIQIARTKTMENFSKKANLVFFENSGQRILDNFLF